MAESKKKQVPLRLSEKLYNAIAAWAEDDFRSVNGQIEYLLTECVRQRKKNGKYVSEHLDEPPELDISNDCDQYFLQIKKEPPLLVTAEALFRRIHSRKAACEIVVPERIFDYPVTFSTIARRQIRNVCRSNSYLGELASASCCASVFRTQCMILAVDFKSRSG